MDMINVVVVYLFKTCRDKKPLYAYNVNARKGGLGTCQDATEADSTLLRNVPRVLCVMEREVFFSLASQYTVATMPFANLGTSLQLHLRAIGP